MRQPIVDRRNGRRSSLVLRPDLHSNCALARGRRHDLGIESLGDPIAEPQPIHSCACEHECVGIALIEPAEPRIDIAVERMDDEVRASSEQEPGASWAVSPDARARWQLVNASLLRIVAYNQCVARVGAGEVCGDPESVILVGRDVLGAVDRDIDFTVEQRSLDCGHKGPLAPRGVRGSPVPVRLDDHDPARVAVVLEGVLDKPRLGERESAPS
ncbi:MAG TPA: hypothetical protein VM451_09820 [Candidatus Limnocylindria bacterium]|nr:hypothetical protein [Candidatus Limnocylindria bacterium]